MDRVGSADAARGPAKPFVSRCHVYDVCQVPSLSPGGMHHTDASRQVLHGSMENPSPGEIYNVVDDDPMPRSEAFSVCRELLGGGSNAMVDRSTYLLPIRNRSRKAVKRPPAMERVESKRVRNDKIKELGVCLAYPSVRNGLGAIYKGDIRPFVVENR